MDTKQTLIKTGALLFSKKSFKEVSVEEVVRKAKVSKGAFYHYFDSKESFYTEIIKEADRVFNDIFAEKLASSEAVGSTSNKIYFFVDAVLTFFQKEQNLYIIIQNEVNKIVSGSKTPFYEFQQNMLFKIKELLPNKEDAFLPYLVMGMLRSAIIYKVQNKTPEKELLDIIWKYLSKCLEVQG